MKLKLSEYALVAEIISAFAIILSLIFVGFQLKDTAAATRSATANATTASLSSWYVAIGQDLEASTVYLTAMENPDALSREQWFQFVMNLHGLMLNFQNNFYLAGEGTLDSDFRDSLKAATYSVKDQPGFHRYWQQRRDIFFPEFQAYIDAIVSSEQPASKGVYGDVIPEENQE